MQHCRCCTHRAIRRAVSACTTKRRRCFLPAIRCLPARTEERICHMVMQSKWKKRWKGWRSCLWKQRFSRDTGHLPKSAGKTGWENLQRKSELFYDQPDGRPHAISAATARSVNGFPCIEIQRKRRRLAGRDVKGMDQFNHIRGYFQLLFLSVDSGGRFGNIEPYLRIMPRSEGGIPQQRGNVFQRQ